MILLLRRKHTLPVEETCSTLEAHSRLLVVHQNLNRGELLRQSCKEVVTHRSPSRRVRCFDNRGIGFNLEIVVAPLGAPTAGGPIVPVVEGRLSESLLRLFDQRVVLSLLFLVVLGSPILVGRVVYERLEASVGIELALRRWRACTIQHLRHRHERTGQTFSVLNGYHESLSFLWRREPHPQSVAAMIRHLLPRILRRLLRVLPRQ